MYSCHGWEPVETANQGMFKYCLDRRLYQYCSVGKTNKGFESRKRFLKLVSHFQMFCIQESNLRYRKAIILPIEEFNSLSWNVLTLKYQIFVSTIRFCSFQSKGTFSSLIVFWDIHILKEFKLHAYLLNYTFNHHTSNKK